MNRNLAKHSVYSLPSGRAWIGGCRSFRPSGSSTHQGAKAARKLSFPNIFQNVVVMKSLRVVHTPPTDKTGRAGGVYVKRSEKPGTCIHYPRICRKSLWCIQKSRRWRIHHPRNGSGAQVVYAKNTRNMYTSPFLSVCCSSLPRMDAPPRFEADARASFVNPGVCLLRAPEEKCK